MSGVISLDFLPLNEVKKETDLDQTSQDKITNQDQTSDQDQIINLDQTSDQSPTSEDQTSEDETSEDQTLKNQITAQNKTSNQDQSTDLLTQQAALMLFLEEKVLIDCEEEEDLISAMLSSFIGSLEDKEWQSLQERMIVQVSDSESPDSKLTHSPQMSQTHLAQVSERIIRVVSQLVLQLLAPSLKVQFQPEDLPRASPYESEEEEEEEHLRKYLQIDEEALVRSLGNSASQLSTRSMLGDLMKQLNQGLCLLAAQSQDSAETEGSEVSPAVMKFLALAGETLAHLKDEDQDQDVDTISKRATEEVMFAIADTMARCQVEGRKSTKILRDLATKISEQCSTSEHQQLSSFTINLKIDSDEQPEEPGVPVKPYPIHVSPEKINSDLSEFHGSCLQVLKGLLAKLLVLSSPQSFSVMTAPHRSSLPSVESAAFDILDIVVNGVKELCQKKKSKFPLRRRKTKVKEKKVNSTATELKVALQEKLGEFLSCHKDAVEQQKKDKMQKAKTIVSTLLSDLRQKTAECEDMQQEQKSRVQVITSAVRTLLQQVDVCGGDRDRSTLVKLEDLISEDKLSSFSQLLTQSLGPLWSSPVSPAEQVSLFCTAAVKHLLRLFVLPPLSWGMGRVVQVQSDKSSTARLAESAQQYDDVISRYAQLMSDLVLSSLRRSATAFWLQLEVDALQDGLKTDGGEPTQKKKKRRNVIHFFQKLPRKVGKKWRTLRNRMDAYIMDGDSDDEEEGLDPSELRRRRIGRFLHNLSDRIVMAFWVYEPRPWQTMALFPI